jgi:hypothetical protein
MRRSMLPGLRCPFQLLGVGEETCTERGEETTQGPEQLVRRGMTVVVCGTRPGWDLDAGDGGRDRVYYEAQHD